MLTYFIILTVTFMDETNYQLLKYLFDLYSLRNKTTLIITRVIIPLIAHLIINFIFINYILIGVHLYS